MGKVVVSEFIALDGVMEEPHLWSFAFWNDEQSQYKSAELDATAAMLLGRKTYEGFAEAWPPRKGDPFADKFNGLPKYVASSTLTKPTWEKTTVLQGDLSAAVATLKARYSGDIVVHGSQNLVQHLVNRNLVDEYHLLVYPIALGSGRRLFDEGTKAKLTLVKSQQFTTGVMALTYHPSRDVGDEVKYRGWPLNYFKKA
jgi:dihydrofolate reductase